MALQSNSQLTPTARAHNAPLSRFNAVHKYASSIIWILAYHILAISHHLGVTIGSGWRSGSSEHKTGRALDIIIATKVGRSAVSELRVWIGDLVVAWLIENSDAIRIRHIIWNRRIWRRRYRGTSSEWAPLTGRSGVSDWHEDHIHIFLDNAGGYVPDRPLSQEEEDMPITETEAEMIAEKVWQFGITAGGKKMTIQALAESRNFDEAQSAALFNIQKQLTAIASKQGVDIDAEAVSKTILAGVLPVIKQAMVEEGSTDDLAEKVVEKIGRKLAS